MILYEHKTTGYLYTIVPNTETKDGFVTCKDMFDNYEIVYKDSLIVHGSSRTK